MRQINTTATAVQNIKARAKVIRKSEKIALGAALIRAAQEAGYDHWHHVICCQKYGPALAAASSVIPYFTDYRYEYVSSRWGDWIPGRGPKANKLALSDRLDDLFPDWTWIESTNSWDYMEGDPRRFMGTNETCFLVVMDGQFGVLSELETCFVEADGSEYQANDDGGSGNTYLPKAEFDGYKRTYWDSIEALRNEYNKTQFFLCANDVEDRLTVCAFTPLKETTPGHYDAPYVNPEAMSKLDDAMNTAIFG